MQKSIYIDSLGQNVILARRKGTRSIRLAVRSDGSIRLSIPFAVSEKQALKFLEQKSDWIIKHHNKPAIIENNAHIGKSHRIVYENQEIDKIKTRLLTNQIIIKLPISVDWDGDEAQIHARKASERALKKEAENLLPQRLEILANKHKINYRSCNVKKLKSRWGSCDSRKNIVLNIYLIQLDWKLIDYVILHELNHTYHQHHQSTFWESMENLLPHSKEYRKALKQMPTDIIPTSF
jgi:predicted metal-dependent hydrolase